MGETLMFLLMAIRNVCLVSDLPGGSTSKHVIASLQIQVAVPCIIKFAKRQCYETMLTAYGTMLTESALLSMLTLQACHKTHT